MASHQNFENALNFIFGQVFINRARTEGLGFICLYVLGQTLNCL